VTDQTPDSATLKAFNQNIVDEFRANGGKVGGRFADANLLLLTTTGAKSGQPRVSPLTYLRIDGKLIVIGAFAGAAVDPAWVHNLRANSQAHVRRARRAARQSHRRGAALRRVPVQDQPGDSTVRAAAGVADHPTQVRVALRCPLR
jgi:deazaflavin-dependent oxidoreductase (nitroreductase family)